MGSYGLGLAGSVVALAGDLLGPAPSTWPEVTVEWVPPLTDPPELGFFSSGESVLPLLSGGHASFDRKERLARFHKPHAADGHELAHPCLSAVGLVFARWDGRIALHAGAVVIDGVAWGVLGDREAGKSTTLAWLAQAGYAVLCDDLLVVDGTRAFAGPRTVDLRPQSAERLDDRERLVTVRRGERRRLLLSDTSPEAPLGGFVVLGVGDRLSVEPVPVAERMGALGGHLTLRQAGLPAAGLLALVELPMWRGNGHRRGGPSPAPRPVGGDRRRLTRSPCRSPRARPLAVGAY